jgi:PAS domain S-box-containing protein
MKEKTIARDLKSHKLLHLAERPRTKDLKLKAVGKFSGRGKKERSGSKDLYESILDGITSGVWATDKNNVIYYANRAMEMVAGVTQQKLRGYRVLEDSSENTIDHFRPHYVEAKETLQPVYYSEVPIVTPAGKQTYQSGWLVPRIRDGRYDGMICILQDITNEKEIRKALRESAARYGELVENVNSIIMRLDLEGNITFINRFAQEFFGFLHDEIICRNVVGTILPETERAMKSVQGMLKNIGKAPKRFASREHENIRKNGEHAWIAWTNKAIFDDTGRLTEVLCVGNDITELKYQERLLKKCRNNLERQVRTRTLQLTRANEELQQEVNERKWMEEVLRKSEEKYRLVVENANEAIVIIQDGFIRYVNPKATKITGYTEEELTSRPFIDFIHPDDRDRAMERYLRRLKGDSLPNVHSTRIIDGEGNMKWLEINAVLITWMGRPATLSFFNNITERKKAEESLRLFEAAVQQASDSIIITTANPVRSSSKIVFVNHAFTAMTGYTAEEVIGKPSLILQGPSTDNMEWIKLEISKSQGKVFYLETLSYRKDGTPFNLEWQIIPLRNERGKVTHFVSIQRDITERKKAEEKLRTYQEQLRSLASELSLAEEKERRRIATDLHDHIGQTLAITKLKLGTLRDTLPSNGHSGLLSEIWSLVERTIKYTKSLTFELSPPILYELGFEATIEWLGEQIQKQHSIVVEFVDDGIQKPLDKDVSILMFQAVRELFMNVVKHAQAQKVVVSIQRKHDEMQVTVDDDGVGFDSAKIEKNTFGFFSIRERLRHFGGSFVIETTSGKGTSVILTAPIKADKTVEVR